MVACLNWPRDLLPRVLIIILVVHGGWSSWTYGSCSKTCGNGTQTLTRRCNNPTPDCGGNNCVGLSTTQYICNDKCCPGKFIAMLYII